VAENELNDKCILRRIHVASATECGIYNMCAGDDSLRVGEKTGSFYRIVLSFNAHYGGLYDLNPWAIRLR